MSELQEVFARGKKFTIGDKEYEVRPATLGDIEEVAELIPLVITGNITFNFIQFTDDVTKGKSDAKKVKDERVKALYTILDRAFRGSCPKDELKQLDRLEVKEIIDYFLLD